jgi:predicted metal-dependent hydrolase
MVKIDRIIHSRRKTYALVIEFDGSLTVRAPLRTSRAQIEHLVQEKADWIQEKQNWLRSHPEAPHPKDYKNGELFYYLGSAYPLEILPAASPVLQLKDDRFNWRKSPCRAGQAFSNWYHHQARYVIGERE